MSSTLETRLFTPESLATCAKLRAQADQDGLALLTEYRDDRPMVAAGSEHLQSWCRSFEEPEPTSASAHALWQGMAKDGLIEGAPAGVLKATSGTYDLQIISPKLLDAFRSPGGDQSVNYAFSLVRICFRKSTDTEKATIPADWEDVALIDTEIFEIPPSVTEDNLDDREKIHLVYLAGRKEDGSVAFKPVYIGVGTGEPSGRGPSNRTTKGRFRLYRYDIKQNFHLEFVLTEYGRQWTDTDPSCLPAIPKIGDQKATLLLARTGTQDDFLSVSDPEVAKWYRKLLEAAEVPSIEFRELRLEKVHVDLPCNPCPTPFAPDNVDAILTHAWKTQRWYYIAWQHPDRLIKKEGVTSYFGELPEFRRRQYEAYRFQPAVLGLPSDDPRASDLTIPYVLGNSTLSGVLHMRHPQDAKLLTEWLEIGLTKDLYAYGNHPENRLQTAIATWFRLSDADIWSKAIRATYEGDLHSIDFAQAFS